MVVIAMLGTLGALWRSHRLKSQIEETRTATENLLTSEVLRLREQLMLLEQELLRGQRAMNILHSDLSVSTGLTELSDALTGIEVDRLSMGAQGIQIQGKGPYGTALSNLLDRLSQSSFYYDFEVMEQHRDRGPFIAFTLWGHRRPEL